MFANTNDLGEYALGYSANAGSCHVVVGYADGGDFYEAETRSS